MEERKNKKLIPLQDFPNYYIDPQTHEIWSLFKRRSMKEATWHKMSVKEGKHQYFNMLVEGKYKRVTLAKIVLSVQNNVSYYDIPSDTFIFNYNKDRSITIESRTEERLSFWKKRMNEINDNRIKDTKHCIYCLELLLKAYEGDALPLINYVNQRKNDYIRILTSEGYGYDRAKMVYEVTLDRLLDNIQRTTCRPYNFDGWFIKTMKCEMKTIYKKNSREVNPEYLPYFR